MKNKTWDEFWTQYSKPSNAEQWLIQKRNGIINHYLNSMKKTDKLKILEIGCGFASNSRILSKNKNIDVFCLDSSKEIVKKVKRDIKNTYLGNAENMKKFKNNYFDVIFSAGLIEHFRNPMKIISEIKRILKPKGLVITFVPGKYSLWQLYHVFMGKNWQHGYEESYTPKKLNNLLKRKEFQIVKNGGIDPFSINGLFLKLFNINLHLNKSFPGAYTEIYSVHRKL